MSKDRRRETVVCAMDEALRFKAEEDGDLTSVAAFAMRVAKAAERDEDSGHSDAWRRAHEALFSEALARRAEDLARAVGRSLGPPFRSVCYAEEVRGLAQALRAAVLPHADGAGRAAAG